MTCTDTATMFALMEHVARRLLIITADTVSYTTDGGAIVMWEWMPEVARWCYTTGTLL